MTDNSRPLRLGFPVKVMGKPGLKSGYTRRWQKNPHLKCSLELLDDVIARLPASGASASFTAVRTRVAKTGWPSESSWASRSAG